MAAAAVPRRRPRSPASPAPSSARSSACRRCGSAASTSCSGRSALHFIISYLFLKYQAAYFGFGGVIFSYPSIGGWKLDNDKSWYYFLLGFAVLALLPRRRTSCARGTGAPSSPSATIAIAASAAGINVAYARIAELLVSSVHRSCAVGRHVRLVPRRGHAGQLHALARDRVHRDDRDRRRGLAGRHRARRDRLAARAERADRGAEMAGGISPSVRTRCTPWQTQITNIVFGSLILLVLVFAADRPGRPLGRRSRAPSSAGRTRRERDGAHRRLRGAGDPGGRPLLAVDNVEVVYGVSLAAPRRLVRGARSAAPSRCSARTAPARRRRSAPSRACSTSTTASIRDGEIALDGRQHPRPARRQDRRARASRQVPEGRLVFRQLTVEENLRVGATAAQAGNAGECARPDLRPVPASCASGGKQQAGWLSGGEQQMVAIGRALMAAAAPAPPRRGLARAGAEGDRADIFERLGDVRRNLGTAMLLVEQNAASRSSSPTTATSSRAAASRSRGPTAELKQQPRRPGVLPRRRRRAHSYAQSQALPQEAPMGAVDTTATARAVADRARGRERDAAVRGAAGARRRQLQRPAGAADGADRAERRRQVEHGQLLHGRSTARPRGAIVIGDTDVTALPTHRIARLGICAHVPEPRPLQGHDRAREPDGRPLPARQGGHLPRHAADAGRRSATRRRSASGSSRSSTCSTSPAIATPSSPTCPTGSRSESSSGARSPRTRSSSSSTSRWRACRSRRRRTCRGSSSTSTRRSA